MMEDSVGPLVASSSGEKALSRDEIISLIRQETGATENSKSLDTAERGKREDAPGGDKGEDPRTTTGPLLPKDTFSFLAFAPLTGPAFWVASLCFFVQIFSLAVVTEDQFKAGNNSADNRLGVPPYLSPQVSISQFLALTIAVICQSDVLWSINVLFNGYRQDQFECFFDVAPKRLKLRWTISLLARLSEGLFSLLAMFFLIMRADTSKNVLLSFAPVGFISNLDNAVFVLSKWGYFGNTVRDIAGHGVIGDVNFAKVTQGRLRSLRSLCVAAIWIVLVSFWAYITHKQMRGDFLPDSIYVQLGDDEVPYLGLYSDVYDLQVRNNEAMWVARSEIPRYSIKRFRYCKTNKFWTLEVRSGDDIGYNVCKDWLMRSPTTQSYNILKTASLSWQIKPSSPRLGQVQMQGVKMINRNKLNKCLSGHYGPNCEFKNPCQALTVDGILFRLGDSFAVYGIDTNDKHNELSKNFFARTKIDNNEGVSQLSLLVANGEPLLVYENPVYYSVIDRSGAKNLFGGVNVFGEVQDDFIIYELIMCIGRRWARVVIGISGAEEEAAEQVARKAGLLERLFRQVKGHESAHRYVTHIGEAFDVNTLKDTGLPIGFQFFSVNDAKFEPNMKKGDPTSLFCSCPVCPMPDDVLKKGFTVTLPSSPFFLQNMTCVGTLTRAIKYTEESVKCKALQMESVFECGCPYAVSQEQICSLCPNKSPIGESYLEVVPFPGGGLFPQASCGEMSLSIDFRGEMLTRDNEYYCPSMQAGYGNECGCLSTPSLPFPSLPCEIKCRVDGHVFNTKHVVSVFEPNTSWIGWYCGEIRFFVSTQKDELCKDEIKSALADVCCISPAEMQLLS